MRDDVLRFDADLDHVGVVLRSLDAGQAAYERLGFRLTPRSLHQGAVTPGGPVVPWGSGNHCAMFRRGYLELVGITDPALHSSAQAMLRRYEGPHIVAFAVSDADDVCRQLNGRLIEAGLPGLNPARSFEREVPSTVTGGETRLARFRAASTDKEALPEARFVFVEHLTRDLLWQPDLLDHPNGALGLAEVILCVNDLAASRARLSALLGSEPAAQDEEDMTYRLPHGRLRLVTPASLHGLAPSAAPPSLPYVAGFGIAVSDLGATATLLRANGIDATPLPASSTTGTPALIVPPDETHGSILSFLQEDA